MESVRSLICRIGYVRTWLIEGDPMTFGKAIRGS